MNEAFCEYRMIHNSVHKEYPNWWLQTSFRITALLQSSKVTMLHLRNSRTCFYPIWSLCTQRVMLVVLPRLDGQTFRAGGRDLYLSALKTSPQICGTFCCTNLWQYQFPSLFWACSEAYMTCNCDSLVRRPVTWCTHFAWWQALCHIKKVSRDMCWDTLSKIWWTLLRCCRSW